MVILVTNRRLPLLAALAALSPAAALAGPIQDNSFLLEEAYNQEPGVIQHISAFTRAAETGSWAYTFTEEWPVLGQTHQASVTLSYADLKVAEGNGIGDVLLNYRWQAVGDGAAPVAFAPRLTLVIPTGDAQRGLGVGAAGLEVNLPLSVALSRRFVSHVNLGGRWVPGADTEVGGSTELTSFTLGQSFVWLAHPKLNVLVETVYTSVDLSARDAHAREEVFTLNPGLRAAIDVGSLQIVPGVAFPIGLGPSRGDNGIFFYLSLEHPFRWAGPTEELPPERDAKASGGEKKNG
jgi:hypothetical protein